MIKEVGDTLVTFSSIAHLRSRAVRCVWSTAPLPERQRAPGADVPARGDPPRAAPLPSPPGRSAGAHPERTGAPRAAYPGDDGGVPGGGYEQQRRQQQQEQQRGAARAPHGALGTTRRLGGRWGRGAGARSLERGAAGGRTGGRLARASGPL